MAWHSIICYNDSIIPWVLQLGHVTTAGNDVIVAV